MPAGYHEATKTHCPQGHPYDEENTYVYINKKTGRRSRHCRTCLRDRRRAYVAKDENREKERLRDIQRRRSREGINRDLHLKRKYGISLAFYKDMLAEQLGLCAVCRKPPSGKGTKGTHPELVVDHCHTTDTIRGLLCNNCNVAIAHARDNPHLLRAMAEYIERSRE
jgi:hypothetical protein